MPTTQVGSHTVYYDDLGPDLGRGHPVLFLTGLGATRQGWWKQIEPFSRKYRVINMDNRDAGDSALGTAPYTIADMAEDSAGLIENLDLGRTHVIGISMGGMIAQELAIRHPELVDRPVLVSTAAGGPEGVLARPETTALLMLTEDSLETRVRRIFTAIAGEGYMAAHPEDLEQMVQYALDKPMSDESYGRQLAACMLHLQGGTAGRLAQIAAPTLVIHGDDDPLIPCPNGQYLAAHIKNARLVTFPGVGHLPIVESPDKFNREVMNFLG